MTQPVRLHPLAAADLIDTWSWYEAKEAGLGDRFVEAVQAALGVVARWPNSGSPVSDALRGVVERRTTAPGFPYAIRYRTTDDMVVVMAIYHQRRRPDFGANRLP